jgi:hypothetical protein
LEPIRTAEPESENQSNYDAKHKPEAITIKPVIDAVAPLPPSDLLISNRRRGFLAPTSTMRNLVSPTPKTDQVARSVNDGRLLSEWTVRTNQYLQSDTPIFAIMSARCVSLTRSLTIANARGLKQRFSIQDNNNRTNPSYG